MKTLYSIGLKDQQSLSPGQRPGYRDVGKYALKGQKKNCSPVAFALSGRNMKKHFTVYYHFSSRLF